MTFNASTLVLSFTESEQALLKKWGAEFIVDSISNARAVFSRRLMTEVGQAGQCDASMLAVDDRLIRAARYHRRLTLLVDAIGDAEPASDIGEQHQIDMIEKCENAIAILRDRFPL